MFATYFSSNTSETHRQISEVDQHNPLKSNWWDWADSNRQHLRPERSGSASWSTIPKSLVGVEGLEPSRLSASEPKSDETAVPPYPHDSSGSGGTRTHDCLIMREVFYRLNYAPKIAMPIGRRLFRPHPGTRAVRVSPGQPANVQPSERNAWSQRRDSNPRPAQYR